MDDFDLRDILLEATADVQEIVREVMEELSEPHELAAMQKLWASAPDDERDRLLMEDPDFYRELENKLNERR
jgi:hypothetical protein